MPRIVILSAAAGAGEGSCIVAAWTRFFDGAQNKAQNDMEIVAKPWNP
jgi:hypothetical protein